MTNIRMLMVGVGLAAAVVAGCDPYSKATGGEPAIAEVNATSGTDATAGKKDAATNAWTLDVPSTCGPHPVTGSLSAFGDRQVIFVTFNKQMDPAAVQTSLSDCTPANGWLTVTTTPPAAVDLNKYQWFSCYSPSSPTAAEGGSAIIFLADKPKAADVVGATATCDAAVTAPDGWSSSVPVDVSTTGITSVHAVGDVKDKDGRLAHVDVTANYEPNPATVRNFTATPGPDANSLTIAWQHRSCAGSAGGYQYVVRRLDPATGKYTDTGAQPVTVDAANFGTLASRTVVFSSLPADAVQDFQISTVAGTSGFEEPKATLVNVAPAAIVAAPGAAPTVAATPAAEVTPTPPVGVTGGVAPVKINVPVGAVVAGATNYDVYRASLTNFTSTSATTNYGAFSRLGSTGLDASGNPKQFLDISAVGNSRYVYKLVALKSGFTDPKDPATPVSARSADGPISASVITAPAVEPAGEATAVTNTTVTLTFPAPSGGLLTAMDVPNFTLQRAPDAAGKPGTFADVAGAAGTPTIDPDTLDVSFTDTGLTPATTYWYRMNVDNTAGRTDTLGGGGSAEGTPLSVKTSPLATPATPTATRTTTGVDLSWPVVTDAANYVVERSLAAACGFAPVGTPVVQPTTGTVTFSDAGAPAQVAYRVIARDATGNESAPSTPTALVP